jgi:HAD superfamily hydrolase (TIGR01484 family)
MDRTVIPNGNQPEHPLARNRFKAFCGLPEVSLVYVTGRHKELVSDAIRDYDLPEPDFVIADVGTRIYRVADGKWLEMNPWREKIAVDWHGCNRERIQKWLEPLSELTPQEASKQSDFKLSYYYSLSADTESLNDRIEDCLSKNGVDAGLVWSIDEFKKIGLVDLLPRNATKLHGIRFLREQLGYPHDEVIFAGDSGNDLQVLASAIRSVLVANASAEIRTQAQQLAAQQGQADNLYLASEQNSVMGGNYAAGVLQGIEHFAPQFRAKLKSD